MLKTTTHIVDHIRVYVISFKDYVKYYSKIKLYDISKKLNVITGQEVDCEEDCWCNCGVC